MKIAIIAPSPVPFTIGGAEKLWFGLLEYINKHTNHQCELIKIPIREDGFWELIEAYYKFYNLDVSSFDLVISGKYPAWMTQHSNHYIYMLHCLRGFYDCYHFLNLDDDMDSSNKKVQFILKRIEKNDISSQEMFKLLFDLKNEEIKEKDLFNFPGIFIKKIIHFFDKKAMENIKSFSAISKTVAARKEYFPKHKKVNVIYPPSTLTDLKNSNYEYFFTISRLDNAKRIDMIINAYLKTKTEIPLKIAGTGPLSEEFKKLTKDDPRIELLGFISDDELIKYYSNAYAVLFVPYDEDYGLITIEAMMSKKPVITFNDTGGVVEFVEDKKTGLISNPDINELAKNIDFLSDNNELCKEMGKNARKKVENITWKNTVESLLLNKSSKIEKKEKKENKIKLTVVSTYPIYPPRGGGQNRIFYLYKELAKYMLVDIVCLVNENEIYQKKEVAPNLYEIRVPKTKEHAIKEWKIEEKVGIPVTDIAMIRLLDESPEFIEQIKESSKNAKYILSTNPFTYPLIKKYTDLPIIYESQNVEYNLKKQMMKDNSESKKLLEELFEVEKEACLESVFTTVCAFDDAETFEKLYGYKKLNAIEVANGVDLNSVNFVSKEKRIELKNSLKINEQKNVLFIGSWHQPNIEAVEIIFNIAKKLPHINFIIMGSVGAYFEFKKSQKNVGFAGVTTDEEKMLYLSISDIAINPMISGSGTNLKMLDYMASGLPVISSEIGARGLNIPEKYIVTCSIDEFEYYILNIEKYVNIEKSKDYVEKKFSWKVIAKELKNKIL